MRVLLFLSMTMLCAACAHRSPLRPGTAPLDGDALLTSAAACWIGPPWFEAQAMSKETRVEQTREQCLDVVHAVWPTAGQTRLEQLRSFEPGAVQDLVTGIERRAPRSDARELATLADRFAAAQKEAMWARRAADRVRTDLDYDTDRLTTDEQAAAPALSSVTSLSRLFHLSGPYAAEARLLALFTATDRMQLARGLPKRMKIFALADVYRVVFDCPDVFSKLAPSEPAGPGQWLTLLSDAARAAGHPVDERLREPVAQNAAAWAGVLHGFADRIEQTRGGLPPALDLLASGTARRLRAEATGDDHYVSSTR